MGANLARYASLIADDEGAGRGARGTVEQAAQVTWGELGCPTEIGDYRFGREMVRVKHIHLIVAESDPAARFTVVVFRPPLGPAEFMLGHRVA
jgi:hypothetical protein